jgi:hypothetical protein
MRIDLYTKTILTLVALLLAVIVLKPIIQPTPALAQTNLSGVQFEEYGGDYYFFDQKTGDIWCYTPHGATGAPVISHQKVTKLGLPLGQ